MKPSAERVSGIGTVTTSEAGNIAIELVVLGILMPMLVVGFGLNLLSAQRSALAAQQLAREAVRMSATGMWNGKTSEFLRGAIADELGIDSSDVSIEVVQDQRSSLTVATSTARVNGRVERARMVVQ